MNSRFREEGWCPRRLIVLLLLLVALCTDLSLLSISHYHNKLDAQTASTPPSPSSEDMTGSSSPSGCSCENTDAAPSSGWNDVWKSVQGKLM